MLLRPRSHRCPLQLRGAQPSPRSAALHSRHGRRPHDRDGRPARLEGASRDHAHDAAHDRARTFSMKRSRAAHGSRLATITTRGARERRARSRSRSGHGHGHVPHHDEGARWRGQRAHSPGQTAQSGRDLPRGGPLRDGSGGGAPSRARRSPRARGGRDPAHAQRAGAARIRSPSARTVDVPGRSPRATTTAPRTRAFPGRSTPTLARMRGVDPAHVRSMEIVRSAAPASVASSGDEVRDGFAATRSGTARATCPRHRYGPEVHFYPPAPRRRRR